MWKQLFAAGVCWGAAVAWADTSLTDTETRWLTLGWPAVSYAHAQGLPLDIVVQPQPTPGHAPLAMAFIDGRCKLVLSMRDNPEAQSTLDRIPASLLAPVVEAMTAHELGHCWRYVRGAWHTLPAGFTSPKASKHADAKEDSDADAKEAPTIDPATDDARRQMQETRREEAFADLVGLAWTQRQHPALYPQVYAWLLGFRDDAGPPGNHHDTLAWIRLATDSHAFAAAATPFEQAWPLWQQGLRGGE